MKNSIAILLALLLVLCLVPTSLAQADTAPVTGRVSVFHRWAPEDGVDNVNDAFKKIQELEPGIDLVVEYVPPSMYEVQLAVRLASGDAPDIIASWPGGRIESLLRNNQLRNINDLWDEANWKEEFISAVVGGCLHTDGNYYLAPINIMPNTVYYNKKVFESSGISVPKTWDELMSACETLKAGGVTPFALGTQGARWGAGFWFDYLLLNTAGGEFREALMWGKESWQDERVYKVFEIWKDMVDKGYFNDDFAAVDPNQIPTAYVAQGECAMFLMGPWAINTFESEAIGAVAGVDFGSFAFPGINPEVPQSSEGCIEGWAVTSFCKDENYPAVKRVLSYLGTKEFCDQRAFEKKTPTPRKDMTLDGFSDGARVILEDLIPQYENVTLYQNYELATLSEMQEVGMNGFVEFLGAPETYQDICARIQKVAEEVFAAK